MPRMICWKAPAVGIARASARLVHEQVDRRAVDHLKADQLAAAGPDEAQRRRVERQQSSSSARMNEPNGVTPSGLARNFSIATQRWSRGAGLGFLPRLFVVARLDHPVEAFELVLPRLNRHADEFDVREGAQVREAERLH
jgi:hypothetical protein